MMRTLEWLFLLSFIPALLPPFIARPMRRRVWLMTAPLPVLAGVLHLAVEGWRIQMVPLYGLAVLVLMSRLPLVSGLTRPAWRKRGKLISGVMALLVVLCGALAGWLLPVVTLPQPTGPYRVGVVDRELVDEVRGRRLMVSVWYPAAHDGPLAPPAPLTHYPDEVTTGLGRLFGLPGLGLQQLRYSTVAASEGAPIAVEGAPFPVLVFSHGMVGLRLQNSSTLQELASWGYVVVAIDHTDAAAVTVFPDGEARFYDLARFGIPPGTEPNIALMNAHVFPVWVADQRFVYDTVTAWSATDALFAGNLDLTRMGSFGHSFGGATALEVCRVEVRCRAAVDMDGGLYGGITTQPAVRPALLMVSTDSLQNAQAVEKWKRMAANADAAMYWLEVPGSTHLSFTITELLSPLLVPAGYNPRAGLGTIDRYLRAFFDQHLRGIPTPLLDTASTQTDVRWIARLPQ